jgi:hypothetical protein
MWYLSAFTCLYDLKRRSGRAGHERVVLAGVREVDEGGVGEEAEVESCGESISPCPSPDADEY